MGFPRMTSCTYLNRKVLSSLLHLEPEDAVGSYTSLRCRTVFIHIGMKRDAMSKRIVRRVGSFSRIALDENATQTYCPAVSTAVRCLVECQTN